jgi:hypothetical protein
MPGHARYAESACLDFAANIPNAKMPALSRTVLAVKRVKGGRLIPIQETLFLIHMAVIFCYGALDGNPVVR